MLMKGSTKLKNSKCKNGDTELRYFFFFPGFFFFGFFFYSFLVFDTSHVKLARVFGRRYKYAKGSQKWQVSQDWAFRVATSLFDTAGISMLILPEEKGNSSK